MKQIQGDLWCEITPDEITFNEDVAGMLDCPKVTAIFNGKSMSIMPDDNGVDFGLDETPDGWIKDRNIIDFALQVCGEGFYEGRVNGDGITFNLSETCEDPE